MKHLTKISFSILSGLLFGLSWPEITDQTWLIFIAFVPLFYISEVTKSNSWRTIFIYSFLSFLLWHLISVYWMVYSTLIGSITAWLVNSLLMAFVFTWATISSNRIKNIPIELFLFFYWMGFEIMHLFWDLSWPWMNLGNVFCNQIQWIQWYEYSGIYGGALWIILVNGLIFRIIKSLFARQPKKSLTFIISLAFIVILPILFSHLIYKKKSLTSNSIELCIIQPNIDTYQEKFNGLSAEEQSNRILQLLKLKKSNNLFVLPETVIPENFDVESKDYPTSIQDILNESSEHESSIIGGFYTKKERNYNSALLIENGVITAGRNKMKLLPFGESIPFEWLLSWTQNLIKKGGGNGFTYGRDQEARVLKLNKFQDTKVGVLICFESVFQDISSELVRNGAEFLVVITNDDWWYDSPGHRQHFAYSRLRAIENRRDLARSANTGISGFINAKGDILQASTYKETCILTNSISLSDNLTFFSKHEAHIRYSIILMAILLFINSILKFKNKKMV